MKAAIGLAGSSAFGMTEDDHLRRIWFSGELEEQLPKHKKREKITLESITADDCRAVLHYSNGWKPRVKVRRLERKLRNNGIKDPKLSEMINEFLDNEYSRISSSRYSAAVTGRPWRGIARATESLPEPYRNISRAIAIEESCGGQYNGATGGRMHDPARGPYQQRIVVISDAAKHDEDLKSLISIKRSRKLVVDRRKVQAAFSRIVNGDLDLATQVMVGYIKFIEGSLGLNVEEHPGLIMLSYNGGCAFAKYMKNVLKIDLEDTDEVAAEICKRENVRAAIKKYTPKRSHAKNLRIFGPDKRTIMKKYRKGGLYHIDSFRLAEMAKAY